MKEVTLTIRFDVQTRRTTVEWPDVDEIVFLGMLEKAKLAYTLGKLRGDKALSGRIVVADESKLPPGH